MKVTADKSSQSNASADRVAKSAKKDESLESAEMLSLGVEDKRPEAIAQRKLQVQANDSPHTQRSIQLQEIMNNSRQVQRLGQMQQAINDSPLVAQRMQSGAVVQMLNPGQLHDDDEDDFDTFIQNIRNDAANINWDWDHISDRHTIEGGMEEGEIRYGLDDETAYFASEDQDAIGALVIEAIANGSRYWHEDRDTIWFIYDFGRHMGGYPDGTSATRLQVYIDTSAMNDSGDTGNAFITTAFPRG